ncbi:hypothetical protein SUDANB140_06399 [Streptomyces sp. enrichment culture]
MGDGPARPSGQRERHGGPWIGVFFLLGFCALFAAAAVVCAVLAFFLQGWRTGCVLLAVAAVSALINLSHDRVTGHAERRSGSTGAGRAVPDEADRGPSPWSTVAALAVLLGTLGLLAMVSGLIAFLVTGWGTAFTLLAGGAVSASTGFVPLGRLQDRAAVPPEPSARVRAAAAESNLGEHVRSLNGPNPIFWLVMVAVVVIVPFLISAGITWVVGDEGEELGSAAAPLLLGLFLLLLAGPCLAVMILCFMPKSLVRSHLYNGGLVQTVNGRLRCVRWEEVSMVEAQLRRASVVGCRVVCVGRGPLRVRADRDPVGDQLRFWSFTRALVDQAGARDVPVHPQLERQRDQRA